MLACPTVPFHRGDAFISFFSLIIAILTSCLQNGYPMVHREFMNNMIKVIVIENTVERGHSASGLLRRAALYLDCREGPFASGRDCSSDFFEDIVHDMIVVASRNRSKGQRKMKQDKLRMQLLACVHTHTCNACPSIMSCLCKYTRMHRLMHSFLRCLPIIHILHLFSMLSLIAYLSLIPQDLLCLVAVVDSKDTHSS